MERIGITLSLWLYVIHRQNAKFINFLKDCKVEPTVYDIKNFQNVEENSYEGCFIESIKCNYNYIANYFLSNYLQNKDQIQKDAFSQYLKYYNFGFLQKEHVNMTIIYYLKIF